VIFADPFDFFRFCLGVIVVVYGTIRLALSVWRWHEWSSQLSPHGAFLQRYLLALLLRTRWRAFLPDLAQIGVMVAVLFVLLRLHR